MKKELLLIVLLSILLSGCSNSNQGTLVMKITDAPSELNLEKVIVTVSSVEVHKAAEGESADVETENGWTIVVDEPKTFDLIQIKDVKEFLGSTNLTTGKYTQVRLNVQSVLATIDGKEHDLKLPSQTLKLVHGFDIESGKTTSLLLDFDAQESIKAAGNDEYSIRPTIKITTE
ncbi:MAG: DUF4382 domain-containing protein [Candidatus Woesearchaeota archaeon]|nr:DUF4382 domain-containing protein [Candidatus Woesearchaeota archaeon]